MKQRRSGKAKAVATQAMNLYEEKKYKEALAMFDEAISYDDEFGRAWYYKGLILKEFKRYPEAIKAFSRAGELDTELKPQAFPEKGNVLVKIGCYIDAVELFFLLEQQGFNIPGLQNELENLRSKKGVMDGLQGRSYLQNNDPQKAIISLRASLKSNPKDKAVWRMLGEAHEKQKNYTETLNSYAKAIECGEDEQVLLYSQGICFYHLKNYRKAKNCFDKFLEFNPNNVSVRKIRIECNAAIERGEAQDADEEEVTSPLVLLRREKERKKKLMGWSFVLVSIIVTGLYWLSIDWRLARSLDSNDIAQKNASIYILSQKGNKDSGDKIITLLEKDDNPSVRSTAALALGTLKLQKAEIPLINALKDREWNVRCCAAKSLGLIGSKEAVESLAELMKRDIYFGVRLSIVEALGKIRGAGAVNALLSQLKSDDSPHVKRAIIEQLKDIAEPKAVLPELIERLKDPDVLVRIDTAAALGYLKDRAAIKPLQDALQVKGEDQRVLQSIKEALNNLK